MESYGWELATLLNHHDELHPLEELNLPLLFAMATWETEDSRMIMIAMQTTRRDAMASLCCV